MPIDAGEQFRPMQIADQHQAVVTALEQERRFQQFTVPLVSRIRYQERVARLPDPLLEARQHPQAPLILDVRHHCADRQKRRSDSARAAPFATNPSACTACNTASRLSGHTTVLRFNTSDTFAAE